MLKSYYYEDAIFDIKDVYDNSYSYLDVVFDVRISLEDFFKKLKDEILNNPDRYPNLSKFLKVSELLEEGSMDGMLEAYIYMYPWIEYYDDKMNIIPYDVFSVKVRYIYDGERESLDIEDIYYPDVERDKKIYRESAKDILGTDDKRTLDKFIEGLDEYIDAYWNVSGRLIRKAVEEYFMDIVVDFVDISAYMENYDEDEDEDENNDIDIGRKGPRI